MRTVPEGLVLEGQVSADAVDRSLTRPKLVREGGVGESSVFSCHCIDKPDQGLVVPHGLDFLPSRDLKRLFLFNCLLNALDQFRPASDVFFMSESGIFFPLFLVRKKSRGRSVLWQSASRKSSCVRHAPSTS